MSRFFGNYHDKSHGTSSINDIPCEKPCNHSVLACYSTTCWFILFVLADHKSARSWCSSTDVAGVAGISHSSSLVVREIFFPKLSFSSEEHNFPCGSLDFSLPGWMLVKNFYSLNFWAIITLFSWSSNKRMLESLFFKKKNNSWPTQNHQHFNVASEYFTNCFEVNCRHSNHFCCTPKKGKWRERSMEHKANWKP